MLERLRVRMPMSIDSAWRITSSWIEETRSIENLTVFSSSSWAASARREAASGWLSSCS